MHSRRTASSRTSAKMPPQQSMIQKASKAALNSMTQDLEYTRPRSLIASGEMDASKSRAADIANVAGTPGGRAFRPARPLEASLAPALLRSEQYGTSMYRIDRYAYPFQRSKTALAQRFLPEAFCCNPKPCPYSGRALGLPTNYLAVHNNSRK